MKIQSITLFVIFVVFVCLVRSEEDFSNKKSGLLSRRNVNGRPGPLSKVTSTTAQPVEEHEEDVEYSEEEYQAVEKHQQEPETTTTEAPKRITLAVRPFRSNDDLLNALKKRRLQVKSQQQQQQQPKTVTEKQVEYQRVDEEERETTKPQSRTKSTKSSPAAKKRTFGGAKLSTKSKVKEPEPTIEEPSPSASSPLAERIGRSRFSFNRGARL